MKASLFLTVALALGLLPPDMHRDEVRTVRLVIRHSGFSPSHIEVAAHERVRFVISNTDPIDHELIIGDDVVQRAHELGTEAVHGSKPGEVTVFAGSEAATHFEFGKPGRSSFACHFPGHYAYGMKGSITIK